MNEASNDDVVLALPPNAPRMPRNRFIESLGRAILRAFGWRMVGGFPDIPKAVVIAAPFMDSTRGYWMCAG